MGTLNDSNNLRAIAQYYVKTLQLPIIPLCSADHAGMSPAHIDRCKCPGKTPLVTRWSERGVPTMVEVATWFKDHPTINIGLLLGSASDLNLVGVDIDNESGEQQLQEWSQGVVPPTWEFTTGRGRRLLYRLPWGVESKKNKFATSDGELALCCSGQQTVLAPSKHASGVHYQWVAGRAPNEIEIAEAPLWIVNRVCKLDHFGVEGDNNQALQIATEQAPMGPTIGDSEWSKICHDGERSNHLARLAGSLIAKKLPKDAAIAMLNGWNRSFCTPPLAAVEISAMVESIWLAEESQKQRKEQQKAQGAMSGSKQILQPILLAKEFVEMQKAQGYHWRYSQDRGSLYFCSDFVGPWMTCEDIFVEKSLRPFLIEQDITWGRSNHLSEAMKALKEYLVDRDTDDIFDLGKHADPNHIVVRNGILDWRTEELKPWDPQCYSTLQLPVDWNPKARNSEGYQMWIDALEAWLPEQGTRDFLQEYIGYCLVPSTDMRTAVFLFGEGFNGKSLFLDVISKLFGKYLNNTSLQRLADKFESINLTNKLVNICGDVDSTYMAETALLKAIIGGDKIKAEAKFKGAFDFTPFCRLIFSANQLPRTADKSAGWYGRWKMIEFPHNFGINPEYKNKLLSTMERPDSMSALLLWAVEGLQRLRANGAFTNSAAIQKALHDYQCYDDSIMGFLHDCFTIADEELPPEYKISARVLYRLYDEWCKENGMKVQNSLTFGKRMTACKVQSVRKPVKKVTTVMYVNLIPKEDASINGTEVKVAINIEQAVGGF